ncbi:MAG: hypothetical protein FJ010_08125 [Chloroflexi bacterium]|nr:hypothetical protein [Chloroflexota bacterium]
MRLTRLRIRNYRSIVDTGDIFIEALQGFVGENNSGKSNILNAIQIFLTSGTGGINQEDFFDANNPITITATFGNLSQDERKRLRPYLIGDELSLEKTVYFDEDKKSGKVRPKAEYHGYRAIPKDWWLSVEKVIEHTDTSRPKWEEIAIEKGILEYVQDSSGKVDKSSYEAGLRKLIIEREDIEFDESEIGDTQALGFQSVLLDELPLFRILPAITDYSDEIDRRSSSTNFRLLMGDLAERILRYDDRFLQVEDHLNQLSCLLNPPKNDEKRKDGEERLKVLEDVEAKLSGLIARLMPSVQSVQVGVEVEQIRDVFSRGVSIKVNDGRLTEVLMKGHGLQRCVVFGLIQALILNQRGLLIDTLEEADGAEADNRTIILAIEEPELYIHPQMQRVIFSALRDFSTTDQVIYSTHSPYLLTLASTNQLP